MRKLFVNNLLEQAKLNKDIILLTGDLGYGLFDEFQAMAPEQFFNVGASEQAMIDIAIGMAYSGKIPFCYSITPFLLYRPFESLRTYINHENIPVKLIGSGRNQEYKEDGISHWSDDASLILDTLPNIVQFWPQSDEVIPDMVNLLILNHKPSFISLKR